MADVAKIRHKPQTEELLNAGVFFRDSAYKAKEENPQVDSKDPSGLIADRINNAVFAFDGLLDHVEAEECYQGLTKTIKEKKSSPIRSDSTKPMDLGDMLEELKENFDRIYPEVHTEKSTAELHQKVLQQFWDRLNDSGFLQELDELMQPEAPPGMLPPSGGVRSR